MMPAYMTAGHGYGDTQRIDKRNVDSAPIFEWRYINRFYRLNTRCTSVTSSRTSELYHLTMWLVMWYILPGEKVLLSLSTLLGQTK